MRWLRSASIAAIAILCGLTMSFLPIARSTANAVAVASAATIRTARASGPSVDRSSTKVAIERAAEPESFGILPPIGQEGAIRAQFKPAWLQHAVLGRGDRRIDGVVLGPTSRFPALGNDQGLGDCTVLAARDLAIASALRFGRKLEPATTAQAIAAWRSLNEGTSNGLNDHTLLDAWAGPSGILGSSIAGWESLNVNWKETIEEAIVSTGGVYASLQVPSTISWSRLVWSWAPSSTRSVGGHAVALIGWYPRGWIAVSWGEVVLIPWSYWGVSAVGAYLVNPTPLR